MTTLRELAAALSGLDWTLERAYAALVNASNERYALEHDESH